MKTVVTGNNSGGWFVIILFLGILAGCFSNRSLHPVFQNPLLIPHAADPWIILHEGTYYYCESTGRSIRIRKTTDFTQLRFAESRTVWSAPDEGPYSQNVWAPELHFLDGRWYIYFAADDGYNENHRMYVLESQSDNPFGPYIMKGKLQTQGWAIDGTIWQKGSNTMYFIWSGWPVDYDIQQNLYIAPMKNPWTLETPRRLLAEPDQPYERHTHLICEGPVILHRNNRTFLFYSASASWTEDYCLAYMEYTGENPLELASWEKKGVFMSAEPPLYGPGHNSFTASPDGKETWILFHVKTTGKPDWSDRQVHAQKVYFDRKGKPVPMSPLPPETRISLPSY